MSAGRIRPLGMCDAVRTGPNRTNLGRIRPAVMGNSRPYGQNPTMITTGQICECDQPGCQHRWLLGDVAVQRCPKCRSRAWNQRGIVETPSAAETELGEVRRLLSTNYEEKGVDTGGLTLKEMIQRCWKEAQRADKRTESPPNAGGSGVIRPNKSTPDGKCRKHGFLRCWPCKFNVDADASEGLSAN